MEQLHMPLFDLDDLDVPVDRYPAALVGPQEALPKLRELEIEALKGIEHVTLELQPFTILTGPNDSGKSTILQAILLGFECFRLCLDTSNWTLSKSGRALSEFDFLPVNELKDLWYRRIWKPARDREQYVRVRFTFDNGVTFVARIRFLFGMLNVGLETFEPTPTAQVLQALAGTSPVLIPATPGPQAHEPVVALAQLHRLLGTGEPSRVVRNILLQLQGEEDAQSWEFVAGVVQRYFGLDLAHIDFEPRRDLELRVPYAGQDFSLDIVSAGSGLNQMLQLAAIVAWRRPGMVLLDEPDSHLHTALQVKLLDFLLELSTHYDLQIVAATHSRDLISQAPLSAIVPVDLSRDHLEPLESVEHLLLEFERQGTVSNVDLALLYQTKRCLFVEGSTDCRLLPKIAERLGCGGFQGRGQLVPFGFGGVDELRVIPRVVQLFERMIGAQLTWAVVRDRDANLPRVIEWHREQAAELGIPHCHIWEGYSIENLLLDPHLVAAAVGLKSPAPGLGVDELSYLLQQAVQLVEEDSLAAFVTKAQAAYRKWGVENAYDQAAQDALNFLRGLTELEQKLLYYPGKRIFGQLVQLLQEEHGINLRLDDIVAQLTEDNAPEDIRRFVDMLREIA